MTTAAANAADPRALEPLLQQDASGKEIVNPARENETAIWLQTDARPMLPLHGGQTITDAWAAPRSKNNGDVEINALKAFATVPFTCRLREPTDKGGWYYSNAPIHHSLMFGRGGQPMKLIRPIYLPAGSFMDVEIASLASALDGEVTPVAIGRWLGPKVPDASRQAVEQANENRRSRPYWLTNDKTSITLTAGQTLADIFMTMPSGLRLVHAYCLARSTGPASADIYEFEEGIRLTQGGPVDLRILAGNARVPGEIPAPLITEPVQRLNIKLNDLSGAANKVWISFHGIAVEA